MMISYPENEDIEVLWRVSTYVQPTRRRVPDDFNFYQHGREILKSSTYWRRMRKCD